ncbi:MAG: class I SAM-dependent methyltransferase [Anaerolineae bacterium]|nr:class I SAM-dependent methyltransferase [Anaerolineae bacterium]
MADDTFPGLDFAFLDHFGVTPENQRRVQSRYVPYFRTCETVVDLACGTGDFLTLLQEMGIRAVGVDTDPECCRVAGERGLTVVQQDVVDYLQMQEAHSVDGFFTAHLVEHLRFETVLRMFQECHRVLRPGGVIVVATPNVRSLFAHLDMYYLHYGHVAFYHPELLRFFLGYCGFVDTSEGENEECSRPLLASVMASDLERRTVRLSSAGNTGPNWVNGDQVFPDPSHVWGVWWRSIKMWAAQILVKPYVDLLARQVQHLHGEVLALSALHNSLVDKVDRPFEVFVVAHKLPGSEAQWLHLRKEK